MFFHDISIYSCFIISSSAFILDSGWDFTSVLMQSYFQGFNLEVSCKFEADTLFVKTSQWITFLFCDGTEAVVFKYSVGSSSGNFHINSLENSQEIPPKFRTPAVSC